MTLWCLGILICQWIFMNIWFKGIISRWISFSWVCSGFSYDTCTSRSFSTPVLFYFIYIIIILKNDTMGGWEYDCKASTYSKSHRVLDSQLGDDLHTKPFWAITLLPPLKALQPPLPRGAFNGNGIYWSHALSAWQGYPTGSTMGRLV